MLTLEEAKDLITETIYGAAMTPDLYIFTVFPESPVADLRTVNKQNGKIGWMEFSKWCEEVDANRVTRIHTKLSKDAST